MVVPGKWGTAYNGVKSTGLKDGESLTLTKGVDMVLWLTVEHGMKARMVNGPNF